ncbi:NADPH--cytochrome P450 reductase [Hondaea fermentalgiana]|uniref:NADPH--hemoprotein reductase n=1 Tax=Hondaea fermentalgiana TaxID=2315210 RepID=A0A2R5G4I9_9STRA|nr:NADPH--cytochrome P450 reductase [Hondaea fermentalgiana]|eukprot:GBG25942.1 NADPH--cytochrome P450 reductase [Hondaea fermentalgiana]
MSMLDYGVPLLALVVFGVLALSAVKTLRSTAKAGAAGASGDAQKAANAAQEEKEDDRVPVAVYFGSQTGTAEGFAKDVAKIINATGRFKTRVLDLEVAERTPEKMQAPKLVLFLMATYGEGDPCDNSIDFMEFLTKNAEDGGPQDGWADGIGFAVFGLGNTQYEQYNEMGKRVHARMTALGGTEVHPLGLGDDDDDLESDFEKWREGLVESLAKFAFSDEDASALASAGANAASQQAGALPIATWHATYVPSPEDEALRQRAGLLEKPGSNNSHVDISSRQYYSCTRATVLETRELRQDTGAGNTIHIEFDLENTSLKYETADNLTVCAANATALVESTAKLLSLDLDQWFTLQPVIADDDSGAPKPLFPSPCTIRTALTYFTDLNGAPTRSLMQHLAGFVSLAEHRERMLHLASRDGAADFHANIAARKLSVAEIFETFPSFKVEEDNLGVFFELMPRLKGREFTIASSSSSQPSRVALTVGVVREMRSENRPFEGVASTFLHRLSVGSSALIFIKESTFKMPEDPKKPIILVGPGTGIAPMRAFVQERIHQRQTRGLETGETVLFFGCRREDEDFLYKDELKDALASGALTTLHTAFSRQQAEKVYVQHVMEREHEEIWRLLEDGAHVYVCGATSMGKDVTTALVKIAAQHLGNDTAAGTKFVADLQSSHKLIQELWSS